MARSSRASGTILSIKGHLQWVAFCFQLPSALAAAAVADIAALGLLRSREALAEQLRLTLSHQVCFDHRRAPGRPEKCWFSPRSFSEIFGSSTAIVDKAFGGQNSRDPLWMTTETRVRSAAIRLRMSPMTVPSCWESESRRYDIRTEETHLRGAGRAPHSP